MVEKSRIGARMRKAAETKGISAEAVATSWGVKSETVYRTYQGIIAVTAERLGRFATLVGQPVGYFYQTEETELERSQELAAALVRIFGDMMAGRTPDEAYDRETGQPLWLNPEVRAFLQGQAAGMRAAIERVAGQPWDSIDGAQKQRVLQEFVRLLLPEEDLGLRRGQAGNGVPTEWPRPELEKQGQ